MKERLKKLFCKAKKFWKQALLLILILALVAALVYIIILKATYVKKSHSAEDAVTVLSYTDNNKAIIKDNETSEEIIIDYKELLMGEATRTCSLIVMEQSVSVLIENRKDGLFGWDIFSQTKDIVYAGVARYEVDLSDMTSDCITVDEDNKIIEIEIPEPTMSVEYLPEKTQFYDTDNGLLAFGEMDLTPEVQTQIEISAMDELERTINEDEYANDNARTMASYAIKALFQTVVTTAYQGAINTSDNVDTDLYTVEVKFADNNE